MAAARKIPEAEWDIYKSRLHSLYITENANVNFDLGLPLLAVCSGCCSNQDISKAQYIRQFEKWGFKKNSNRDLWKAIAWKVHQRKSRGKRSEFSIKDRQISDQKLRKEMSRYPLLPKLPQSSSKKFRLRRWTRELTRSNGPSFEEMDDLVVQTPLGESVRTIEHLHLPFFEFQALIERYSTKGVFWSLNHGALTYNS